MSDSAVTTKDFMGVHPLPTGWSDFFLHTDNFTTHLAIPWPPSEGPVFTYATSKDTNNIRPMRHNDTSTSAPYSESNRYDVLRDMNSTNESLSVGMMPLKGLTEPPARAQAKVMTVAGHRAESPMEPTKRLAKHSASSLLQAKALNNKVITTSLPTLTAPHQSRPASLKPTAVTNA